MARRRHEAKRAQASTPVATRGTQTKDITKRKTLTNVHENDEGTGIYWFLDGSGRREQIFVPRVRHERADELAGDFNVAGNQKLEAYRWVPEQIETVQSLVSKPCGGKCQEDIDCVDNACRCIDGQCRRK
jgi:hypothetical protein